MSLAAWTERHGKAVLVVTALVTLTGALALPTLPSAIYPALHFPRIVIIAKSAMLPPAAMTLAVTRPLEAAAMEVPGIRRVRSSTFRGASEISAQFSSGTDMDLALQRLQSRVEQARDELPPDLDLTVERLTAEQFPMFSFHLTGGLPTADLRDDAFYLLRPALARVPGVGRIEVLSSETREIEVVADPGKLLAAGLTVADLAEALRAANHLAPVGRYTSGGKQHLVLASGAWSSLADVARTPVALRGAATLRVSDLASVFPGTPDRTAILDGDGREAAVVTVAQQPGANILDVKDGVVRALRQAATSLPSGLRIAKVYDLAELVASAVANVRDAILIGGGLAVLVLLVFLRNGRMTLIAALTLPLTVLATFLVLRLLGESINLMSMGGLAVAIGLVIDDAVVVVENLHRRLTHGGSIASLAEATAELVAPVVSSTLTSIVVLAPLALLSGVVGQFFRSLALTLSVAVLVSLLLALGLIPLLARFAFRRPEAGGRLHAGAGRLENLYGRGLAAALRRPRLAFGAAALLALLAGVLLAGAPTGFLPAMDEGGFVVDYRTPPGTALEVTDREVRKLEALLQRTPEVAAFSRRTGSELGLFATEINKGDILVRLKARSQRERSAEEVIEDLRPRFLQASPGTEIEFVQLLQDMIGDLEGTGSPVEVKIFGDDPTQLNALAGEAEEILGALPGVVDLVGPERGAPELTWEIDPVAAGRLGLSVRAVSDQLAAAWSGEEATPLRRLDRSIPVRVRLPDADRFDPERFGALPIRGTEGRLAPLSSLARPVHRAGEGTLLRENLRPMALVTARLEGRDLGGAVREIEAKLRALRLPVGVSLEVGGEHESQRRAFQELLLVFGLAASLVFLILLIQFRAFTPALLILAAAPLSLGGAFLLLRLTGTELNVSSAMGLILLVGLAVKNGIVLLDYAHRLHAGGLPFAEAVAQAARVRLRPILMTTLCTLFGLLPLALGLGAGAELQRPLALAVIGGLSLSTLVTLYIVPAAYVALRRERK